MAKDPWCPLIGEECMGHQCAWYINIKGRDPQTGNTVDNWMCAISAIPMLQIENSQASRATQAATVEVREEVRKQKQAVVMAALGQIQTPDVHVLEDDSESKDGL